jgi:hypothetical protein
MLMFSTAFSKARKAESNAQKAKAKTTQVRMTTLV